MHFVECIRRAAATELDESGTSIPQERRLVVFPGMELTLSVPCQALLLFDADFPADLFKLVTDTLGIVPAASENATTAQVQRLTLDLRTLHERLDHHDYLRDQYIVFDPLLAG
jgi:chromosome segregation protein